MMSEEWFESVVVPYPDGVEVDILEYLRTHPLALSAMDALIHGSSMLALTLDEAQEVPGLQNLALMDDAHRVTNLGRFAVKHV